MTGLDPPLVVHVIHELGVGGLENGLVNLINSMARDCYRHAIVCMTGYTDFRHRIRRGDVEVIAMNRGDMALWRTYLALVQLFRHLRPSIVHSRNLSGLDALIPALCAGVPIRIHGEHGRDVDDLYGTNLRLRRLRRYFRPFVTRYTAVSKDLERYLINGVGVPPERVTQIYNGVDTDIFHPGDNGQDGKVDRSSEHLVAIGTVGRLQSVKDHVTLVKSFAEAIRIAPEAMRPARLIIVGDGPCRREIEKAIEDAAVGDRVSMLGKRDDVAQLMRSFDLFVLPSLAEGISNTILEAMATGLPVLATRVGGNAELVIEGEVGQLVDAGDWQAMAKWLIEYARDPDLRRRHGLAARARAQASFSMHAMVGAYRELYDSLLNDCSVAPGSIFRGAGRQ